VSTTEAIGPQSAQIQEVLDTSQHLSTSDLHELTQLGIQIQDEDIVGAFGRAVAALEAAGRDEALGDVLDTMQVVHAHVAEELLAEWFSPEEIRSWGRADALQKLTATLAAATAGVVGALAARDLIEEGGFTADDYRLLTRAWRTVMGPPHARDTDTTP